MTKFKVGDKVRALAINGMLATTVHVEIGDVLTITRFGGNTKRYIYAENGDKVGYFAPNGVEKVSDKPTKNQRISALETQVAELTAKVEALEKAQKPTVKLADTAEVFIGGKSIGKVDAVPVTFNEQRKAIIAEAKAFVADVTKRMASNTKNHEGNSIFQHRTTVPEFIVNTEKRTVVALVKGKNYGGLIAKAIAKCAPDDVFNTDIGKAIALGRALGLDVKRFEQAVKPTEVVVGSVYVGIDEVPYKVKRFCDDEITSRRYGRPFRVEERLGWAGVEQATQITDDTDAQY